MKRIIVKAGDYAEPLQRLLETEDWRLTAVRIKFNARRDVYYLPTAPGLPPLFFKCDHALTVKDQIKSIFRFKAAREYAAAQRLSTAGVPVVEALAWTDDSVLVTRELELCRPLLEFWAALLESGNRDVLRPFLQRLGAFVHQLARAGVRHPDLHRGNVLVTGNAAEAQFHLVDVFGVTVRATMTEPDVNLALFLLQFETELSAHDYLHLWESSWPGCRHAKMQRFMLFARECGVRKRLASWPGRRQRYLAGSSLCRVWSSSAGNGLRLQEFPEPMAVQILDAYLAGSAEVELPADCRFAWIKSDRKRRLARVSLGDDSWVVKEFLCTRPVKPCWQIRPDLRSWVNAHMLRYLALPVVPVAAWLQLHNGHGVIIYADVGPRGLGDHDPAFLHDPCQRRQLVTQMARLLGQMHSAKVYHRDCKASNFMVTTRREWLVGARLGCIADHVALVMIDTDDIECRRHGSASPVRRTLAQLLDSLPPGCSLTPMEQCRFAAIYRRITSRDVRHLLS